MERYLETIILLNPGGLVLSRVLIHIPRARMRLGGTGLGIVNSLRRFFTEH